MQSEVETLQSKPRKAIWIWGILPLMLLAIIIYALFHFGTGVKDEPVAPLEVLDIEKITLTDEGFTVKVLNTGPDSVSIAQVIVNDAFWNATFRPSQTLNRLDQTVIDIPYGWVEGDPYTINLITTNGLIFSGEVPIAAKTPVADASRFAQYALIGFYVGVVPVGLGLLWFPFLRRFSDKGVQGILALTIGLLFFLVIDTFNEGLEIGATAPSLFQGTGLVWFGALLSFLFLLALDQGNQLKGKTSGKQIAYKIAGGIGLHNLGEGLAIGAAFAAGEAALGTFLIIGFTLHNVTEGVGIASPLLKEQPSWKTFLALAIVGGAPAIIGTWIGGFIYNPTFASLFFGIGAGAIAQVIYSIGRMILKEAEKKNIAAVSWTNLVGLTLGLLLMYVTALFVSA